MQQVAGDARRFSGMRVLVVEDEALVAQLTEDMLIGLGCSVVLASGVEAAIRLIEADAFGMALLDVNLRGKPIYPVAQALERRAVPFVFVTGYGAAAVHADYRDRPILGKPFAVHDLHRAIAGAVVAAPV